MAIEDELIKALSLVIAWTSRRQRGGFIDCVLFNQGDRLSLTACNGYVLVKIELEMRIMPPGMWLLHRLEAKKMKELLKRLGRIEGTAYFDRALGFSIVMSDGIKETVRFTDIGIYPAHLCFLVDQGFTAFQTKVVMRSQDIRRVLPQFRGKYIEVTIERDRLIIVGRDKDGQIIEKTVEAKVRGNLATRFFDYNQFSRIVNALGKDSPIRMMGIYFDKIFSSAVGIESGQIRFLTMPVLMLRRHL